jgi:phage-related baseplate assembly protein
MTIDLSLLPAPDAVESLSYEAILAAILADIAARDPSLAPALALATDPAVILAEEFAYRELVLRQRVNDAVRARMLAFAKGADLEEIAANEGLTRLTITPANTTVTPAVAAVMESDADLLKRILLSFDAKSTAGAEGTYRFFAFSASGLVKSVLPYSHSPGTVTVYIQSFENNGVASEELLTTVASALSSQTIRPMNDVVSVQSASMVEYEIEVVLYVPFGPDKETVRLAALENAQTYASESAIFGKCPYISGITAATQKTGARNVVVLKPAAEIAPLGIGQIARCTKVTVTAEQVAS